MGLEIYPKGEVKFKDISFLNHFGVLLHHPFITLAVISNYRRMTILNEVSDIKTLIIKSETPPLLRGGVLLLGRSAT
jgi:hypothetical protein